VAFCGVWPATQIGSDHVVGPGEGTLAAGLGPLLLVAGLGVSLSGRGGSPLEP